MFSGDCRSFKYSNFHNILVSRQSLYEEIEVALLALDNSILELKVENLVGNRDSLFFLLFPFFFLDILSEVPTFGVMF